MRDWTLGPGDPLALTLAADFRLCTPDYANDHIWELEIGGGDPPALGLRTTFGLRARAMRIFPRFHLGGQTVSDPALFHAPPTLRQFAPNFLLLTFAPFPGLEITCEYWIPDSHTAAGRLRLANRTGEPLSLLLELCGQLVPLSGQPLATLPMQSVHVLAGRSADLHPVLFLTGGPQPGPGPYPSLTLDLALASGGERTLAWVQAALSSAEDSFEHTRRTAARPWEAERLRIELVNAAQTVDVRTGDPDWDAAFALSQKTGFSMFFGPSAHLPHPSFVLARQPDQGWSSHGDGSDYGHLWNGQPALEAGYLTANLPGAPELLPGLVRNFLAAQAKHGAIDWKPGLAGQRGRWQSPPLLAGLAWDYARRSGDRKFLREVFRKLNNFLHQWLAPAHDRDGDGFPEWDHPLQSGLEDHPLFSAWEGGQGGDITCAESPALAAVLSRDFHALGRIAADLGMSGAAEDLLTLSANQRGLAEDCWEDTVALYRTRDRDSHRSPAGKLLASQSGPGTLSVRQSFEHPVRLLVQIQFKGEATRRPEISLKGRLAKAAQVEHFERLDFQWGPGRATATTRGLFTNITSLRVDGLEKRDKVSLLVMDFSLEDVGLFLPLWADIPTTHRARTLVNRTLFAADRFGRPFGIPCASSADPSTGLRHAQPGRSGQALQSASVCQAVHLPWNALIGEGLLAYGFREEAAQLTARLMSAVIVNLKKQRAFYRAYHAETGAGLGERNPVHGLAP
ncbi:MAG: hypothetical protein AB1531_08585, partial [Chloroflexota bacterium]